jgi:mono/diheme cytochrome c family protein
MARLTCALLILAATLMLMDAARAADAALGEQMARRWCAACHVVARDQPGGNTQAPPFSAIARKPGFDAGKLALFLLLPHPRMPDMNMSRDEAADLAAYIAAQGR